MFIGQQSWQEMAKAKRWLGVTVGSENIIKEEESLREKFYVFREGARKSTRRERKFLIKKL